MTDNREKIRFWINGEALFTELGTTVSSLLKKSHGVEMPCGGRHACGKCMVYAEGSFAAPSETEQKLLGAERLAQGIRLACFLEAVPDGKIDALRQEADGDETICVSTPSAEAAPDARLYRHLGAAVDIGTTTIAAVLYREGRAVGTMGAWNPQSVFGADVISRMEASLEGKADKLAAIVREAVSCLLTELAEHAGESAEAIETVIITGNTSMLYFLTQKDPRCLSRAPFEADELFGWWTIGEALDLSCRKADVYLPRCMSAFVGADITTAILGSGLTETDRISGADGSRKEAAAAIDTNVSCRETDDVSATHSGRSRLMVDVGTNGEIVLFHKERLICCATAAGPAFEGAGLSCGMRGVAGAIDHVSWENGSWKVHVIGDREASTAEGICGSGVIDGVAGLLESGLLEDTGYLEEDVCFDVLFIVIPVHDFSSFCLM